MSEIQPFQFEPCYAPGEEQDIAEQGTEEASEVSENNRIGNKSWCVCGECQSMPSAESCFCCQELEELDQKVDESG